MQRTLFQKRTEISAIREADGNYIAGLVDGEGHFGLHTEEYGKKPKHYGFFSISLRGDDAEVILWMHSILGCGKVTWYDRKGKSYNGNRCPFIRLACSNSRDLHEIVVPFFDRFRLRAKKVNDFEIWKVGIEFLRKIKQRRPVRRFTGGGFIPRWTAEEQESFSEICQRLVEVRKFQPTRD